MAISTNGTVLTRLAGALYNTQMSNATYKEVASLDPSSLANVLYARDFNTVSDATVASTLVTNLGLSSVVGLSNWVGAQLTAAGANKGAKVVELLNGFAQMSSDATYGAAATAFNAKVDSALALSQATDNAGGAFDSISSAVVGKTFTLTASTNIFNGTSSDDFFDGALNSSGAITYNTSDSVNGAAGTDTLAVTLNAAGTYQASSVSAIENINATFITAASTLSLTGATGYTNVKATGSTVDAAFSGINSTTVALGATNTTTDVTYGFLSSALTGSADSVTVTVSGVNQGATDGLEFTAGIETLNIVSSGGVDNVVDEVESLTTDTIKTLVVSGDTGLTVTDALEATVAAVNASGMSGAVGLTATLGSAANATVVGSSGNDGITVSSITGTVNVDLGAGNDSVTLATNLATTDTLIGGDGTDTLITTNVLTATSAYATPATRTISGFETLRLTDAATLAFDTDDIDSGITTVVFALNDDTNDAADVEFKAGSSSLQIGRSATTGAALSNNGSATTLTVDALGSAGDDQLTIANKNGATSSIDAFDTVAISSTDFETLVIDSGVYTTAVTQTLGTIGVTGTAGYTSAETVKFQGSNNVSAGVITADIIDGSGLTSTTGTTLTLVTGTTAQTVTGSAGNDVLIADNTANVSIDGGAGNDDITGGSGNDNLSGGNGNDSITSGAGNDTVSGGAGNDTITYAGNYTSGDSLDGGDGTDVLSITDASLTNLAALSLAQVITLNGRVANVEIAYISDDLNQTSFDAARLAGISTFRIGDWNGAEALTGLPANSTIQLMAVGVTNSTNDLTLSLATATGASDVLNIALLNNGDSDFGDVTVASVETINISTAEVTASDTKEDFTFDLTATGVSTLNITGTEDLIMTGVAINATTITSTSSGFIRVLGGSSSQTITSGAGADSLSGGGGNDTIDGGSGSDIILGGTGNDSLTGGTGNDTIEGGAGNDEVILTESVSVIDSVVLAYSNSGADIDVVTGFLNGTDGDKIIIDLSDLESTAATGIDAQATNFISTTTTNGDAADGNAGGVEVLTGPETLGDGDNVLVISGVSFSSTDDVETALETGGDFALAFVTTDSAMVQHDAFLVVYSDGTDAYVASARIQTDASTNGLFASGALEVEALVRIVGISSIGSTTFVAGNFAFQS